MRPRLTHGAPNLSPANRPADKSLPLFTFDESLPCFRLIPLSTWVLENCINVFSDNMNCLKLQE